MVAKMHPVHWRIIGRSLAPVGAWSNGWQAVSVVLTLVLGGSFLGVRLGPWQGLVIVLSAALGLVFLAAMKTLRELDQIRDETPNITLHGTEVKPEGYYTGPPMGATGAPYMPVAASASYGGTAIVLGGSGWVTDYLFARAIVANVPRDGALGVNASDVAIRITFKSTNGRDVKEIEGRWSGAPQAMHRQPFHSDWNTPRELPANGQRHGIDVALQDVTDGSWFACNDFNFSRAVSDGKLAEHMLSEDRYAVTVIVTPANGFPAQWAFSLQRPSSDQPMTFVSV